MSSGNDRLLKPAHIPESLWDHSTEVLQLPASLANAYETQINKHGLRELATTRADNEGPVGGMTKENADQHFAQMFDGSAARAILAVVDPKDEMGSTSDSFIKSTAGASLALTDAPCSAGAAALAFLTTLAELRACNVLPRMPLEVKLVGGELSPHAMDHAKDLLELVRGRLEEQAIFVDSQFHSWNVLDKLSTTDLIKASMAYGVSCASKLLVVANFNGFLVKERKQKEAQPQLDELFRYASGGQSLAVWIEPDMNRATGKGGLFVWLRNLLTGGWGRFAKGDPEATEERPVFRVSARFRLPLVPAEVSRVTVAAMPIDLTRGAAQ